MRPGRKHGTKKFLGVILVVGIIAAGTYAFTATNTVAASKAGDGTAAITGYSVTDVAYSHNAVNPAVIDSISFTLDAAANFVRAQLTPAGTWFTCTNTPLSNDWSCDTSPLLAAGVPVTDATDLRVVASE